ncbi:hypothetical protein E4K67_00980 [Desulfosporosinus fructosivorans]|uniref:Uncharacterized protein n=1 Tax=Desulfosporosinus fructosivorans TaxID=2018669 RepID=A0A4Z0RB10_9FIRM|nr:hypothetical protein E4K67_00980 [Desulfosporosinus fructosivorans]
MQFEGLINRQIRLIKLLLSIAGGGERHMNLSLHTYTLHLSTKITALFKKNSKSERTGKPLPRYTGPSVIQVIRSYFLSVIFGLTLSLYTGTSRIRLFFIVEVKRRFGRTREQGDPLWQPGPPIARGEFNINL